MKRILSSIITLNTVLLFCCASCVFTPGSYPYAERYEIRCSESDLIHAVENFKIDHPEYLVPSQTQLKDGRSDKNDHWYHVYFYYKNDNKIVYTWIRKSNEGTTTFAFVAVNNGLKLGNWKDINKDFSKDENKLQKKKFESLILNEIKKQIQ